VVVMVDMVGGCGRGCRREVEEGEALRRYC
jgi:hypothetical protein